MLKKRMVFTLLWNEGRYCLSRNFRLQHVGDRKWLEENYDFATVASSVDELCMLDVSRSVRLTDGFLGDVSWLASRFQMPLSVGGGVYSIDAARSVLRAGADKVIVNSGLFEAPSGIREIRDVFGQQCIVGSIDVRASNGSYQVYSNNGVRSQGSLRDALSSQVLDTTGELLINSIDADGTGHGLDFRILEALPPILEQQVVLMGGVGKPSHIVEALEHSQVDAVATANLLNFIGNGLGEARRACRDSGIALPRRISSEDYRELRSSN